MTGPAGAVPSAPVAVMLCGGANTRFWPLREKSLLWFCSETLLARQVRLLEAAGIVDVIAVANPANVSALTAELATLGRHDAVVVQPEARGMGDAVLHARPFLTRRFPGRSVLICQVHDVVEPALLKTVMQAQHEPAAAWMVGQVIDHYFPGGYLALDGDRIVGVVEKPGAGHEPSNVVNLVIHLFHDPEPLFSTLEALERDGSGGDDQYERALAELMPRFPFRLVRYTGRWEPIKYPWHVLGATEMLLSEIDRPRVAADIRLDDGAGISGPVVVEPGVRLLPGAQIVGPSYIGAGTLVGNGALVRHAMVGPRCIVGIHTEIARSYVGEGCEFHENYIGDSVIGPGTSFGAGTKTANLRLDERTIRSVVKGESIDTGRQKLGVMCGARARAGVNASLMPGVKIGQESAVGPGVVLTDDLPDQTRVMVKQALTFRRNRPPAGNRDAFRRTLPS